MIAKGAARNNPRQLAVYLMRVERYETGEPVVLLQFDSGWAKDLNFEKGPDDIWRIASPVALRQTAAKLIEGFRDWQVLTEGTQQGRDGLYHSEVNPAPEYADKMTPDQWKRSADILAEELGLQNQPRAIVLHGGTDGRKHMHIVWARVDVETMKVISDGYNFAAHERASYRMELEFGHDFVPGKHAKRDRELQPEFPRQDFDYAEAQMAERSPKSVGERMEQIRALQAAAANGLEFKRSLEDAGYILAQGERGYIVVDEAGVFSALSKNLQGLMKKPEVEAFMADVPLERLPTIKEARALQKQKPPKAKPPEAAPVQPKSTQLSATERKDQVTALRKRADNAQAFRSALEETGYVLARGDKRDFVLVNEQGKEFSLSKYVTDIKGKEYKAFMASLDTATLPDVKRAKKIQQKRRAKAPEPGPEASKFLPPQATPKAPKALPAPPKPVEKPLPVSAEPEPPSKFLPPPKAAAPAAPQQTEPSRFVNIPAPSAAPPPTAPPPEDPEITALRNTLRKSQDEDRQKWADFNAAEYRQRDTELRNEGAWKLEDFDLRQQADREALSERLNPVRKGVRGVLDAINRRINPVEAARSEAAKQREIEQFRQRQENERRDFIKRLDQSRLTELDGVKQRQLQDQGERERKYKEEAERFVTERQDAKRFLAEIEADRFKKEQERKELGLEEGESPPGTGK